MTRARTASYGVVTPPPLDRWIEAVLMLCVSLVHRAATTLGMIFNRRRRDWHTTDAREDLPQATSGIQSQELNTRTGASFAERRAPARLFGASAPSSSERHASGGQAPGVPQNMHSRSCASGMTPLRATPAPA